MSTRTGEKEIQGDGLTTEIIPLLPIKNSVLFPHLLMPLAVGRPISIGAVEAALSREEKEICVVAQRDAGIEFPTPADLFDIGTRESSSGWRGGASSK